MRPRDRYGVGAVVIGLMLSARGCTSPPSFWDVVDAHRESSSHSYAPCVDRDSTPYVLCEDGQRQPIGGYDEMVECLTVAWQTCTPTEADWTLLSPDGFGNVQVFIEPGDDGCRLRLFETGQRDPETAVERTCDDLRFVGPCTKLDLAPCQELSRVEINDPNGGGCFE